MITGGAGFIGSHTADALIARGHDVRLLDCLDPQIHANQCEFPRYLDDNAEVIKGDVRDLQVVKDALDGIDVIYHFAAHTGVGQSMYAIRAYVDTNCTGTATLLEAILKSGKRPARLILASSRAVYGEGAYSCLAHGNVVPAPRSRERLDAGRFVPVCPVCDGALQTRATDENHLLRPVSVYGWTKLQQEQLMSHASDALGLETVVLRYFNVIGSRQSLSNPYTGIATAFYGNAMNGQPLPLYERGFPVRDFVHIRDVVAANVLALNAPALPARYVTLNIGTGRPTTIREFAAAVASACGREAVLDETILYRQGDIFACVADRNRAASTLGYAPIVSLEDAILEFVQWAHSQPADRSHEDKAATELERYGMLGTGRGPALS